MRVVALRGDPSGAGAYTLRASLPDGYLFPSHLHATDQQITVIAGTFLFAEGETVVQFHGIGPFEPALVDPHVPDAALGGER